MNSDPKYRGEAAKKILEDEGGDEPKKKTLMEDLEEMEFGGAGLDEAPSDPESYGVGD